MISPRLELVMENKSFEIFDNLLLLFTVNLSDHFQSIWLGLLSTSKRYWTNQMYELDCRRMESQQNEATLRHHFLRTLQQEGQWNAEE